MKYLYQLAMLSLALAYAAPSSFAFGIDKLSAELDVSKGFKSVASFVLFNDTSESMIFATARALKWDMDKRGETQLVPSSDIRIYPSVQKIAPGESATFKVRYQGPPPTGEATYRVCFEEIQLPAGTTAKEGEITVTTSKGTAGLQIGIAMTVPVYVADFSSKTDVLNHVSARLVREGDKSVLEVDNAGDRHIAISAHRMNGTPGGALGVVLAKHQRMLPIAANDTIKELVLTVAYGTATREVVVRGLQ